MKVGTDGVTLGAMAPAGRRVLDAGCGCGLIGLMLAQRGAAEVVMVEIDPAAAAEAADNAASSPWAARVSVACGDFLTLPLEGEFDSIVSNPPFFASGMLAPDQRRAAARHEDGMPADAFMRRAAALLAPRGTVCVILPADRVADWTFAADLCGLRCSRRCELTTRPGADPKRVVATYCRDAGPTEVSRMALNSDPYKTLTSPFYL